LIGRRLSPAEGFETADKLNRHSNNATEGQQVVAKNSFLLLLLCSYIKNKGNKGKNNIASLVIRWLSDMA
jgi:hypothetical protein